MIHITSCVHIMLLVKIFNHFYQKIRLMALHIFLKIGEISGNTA